MKKSVTIVSTSSVGCEGIFRRNVLIFHQKSPFVAGNFSQPPDRHEVLATGSEEWPQSCHDRGGQGSGCGRAACRS